MSKLAILGFGVVGGGVAEVLRRNGRAIEERLGQPLELEAILVRQFREGPYRPYMCDDFSRIERDEDIRVVVETIGGIDPAYDYTRRALVAGKHVVTANKELVAEKGGELLELARENGVSYLFEASVGGGIPILRPLTQCMAANEIEEVFGILNGTTNYILTRMVRSGASFAEALREAQERGYAEADPTADVAGIDACRKTCILANLAFGKQVLPEQVPTEGIEAVDLQDVQIAEEAGWRVKLLGRCLRLPDGGRTAYVAPHLVAADTPIATVEDVYNAIVVRGNATGEVMFYGKGAGDLPTASAVVADVIDALRHEREPHHLHWSGDSSGFVSPDGLEMDWYFRVDASADAVTARFPQAKLLSGGGRETVFLAQALSQPEAEQAAREFGRKALLRVLS